MSPDIYGGKSRTASKSNGGQTNKSETDYVVGPHPDVADFILGAVDHKDADAGVAWGYYEWPFRDSYDEAVPVDDLPEDMTAEWPDYVSHATVESFFDVDLNDSIVYHDEPSGVDSDTLSDEDKEHYDDKQLFSYGDPDKGMKSRVPPVEWVKEVEADQVETRGATYYCARVLNAWYLPEVWETFGAGTRISLSMGSKDTHDSVAERYQWVEFSVQDTDAALLKQLKAVSSDKGESKVLPESYDELKEMYGVEEVRDDGGTLEAVEVEDWDAMLEDLTERVTEARDEDTPWVRDG